MTKLFSDDSEAKKVHECVKRAIILSSGKKIMFRSFCFASSIPVENNRCEDNCNMHDDSPDSLRGRDGDVSHCNGCYFSRKLEYISDTLRFLKSILQIGELKREADNFTRDILANILKIARSKCYLTFDSASYEECRSFLFNPDMCPYDKLLEIVSKMYDFCVENGVK